MTDRTIRVFVSSPDDVRPERLVAERIIRKLARQYVYHVRLEPVLWERQPLTAAQSFQRAIEARVAPRETDLVVVILWSRLGQVLSAEEYIGPISGRPVTGTEWEWEDALVGYRTRAVPDLLLYRKTALPEAKLTSREQVEEQLRQKELVEEFMARWTRDADGRAFTASFREFDTSATFEELFEEHLRRWLRDKLETDDTPIIGWHAGNPYLGLATFEPEHTAVFFGRTRARNALRELLARRAAAGCAFILVIGASGSGKSSLVRAGLLPDVQLAGMVDRVGLLRYAIVRPTEAGGEPIRALADGILGPTALPELSCLRYDAATLTGLLAKGEGRIALEQGLEAAGRRAGLLDHAQTRLLLIVDQLEELFTFDGLTQEARERYIAALEALACSGVAWVVATMRSDFFDRIEALPTLARLSEGEARYLLVPPDAVEIGQIVCGPAREAGLRFEIDAVSGVSLDETIRAAAVGDLHALPLLSFVLEQLWHLRSDRGVLTHEAYQHLGGLEGALGRYAEGVLRALPPEVRDAFPCVLRSVATVGQEPDGKATARAADLARFVPDTPARSFVNAMIAARLLIACGDGAGGKIRLAHEALLTHWPRAAEQVAEDREDLQRRARIEAAAGLWEAKHRDRSLLLRRGLLLTEAEDLVARRAVELNPSALAFVRDSRASCRRASLLRSSAAALILVTAGMGAALGLSYVKALAAVEARRAVAARADVVGTMIAYAGSEGEVVSDGAGDHGLYTGVLLKELARPELSVTEAVLAAHDAVLRDPDAQQTPQISTSLNADVFLHDPPPARRTWVFVVGVSAYTALPPLRNPVTDARAIATVFRMMGYEVDLHLDPTGAALEAAADQFVAAIERGRAGQSPVVAPVAAPETMGWQQPAGASSSALLHHVGLEVGYAPPTELPEPSGPTPGSLAIVYFAGSGIEVDDRSLFPATDAPAGPESDVLSRWFDVSEFVRRLKRAASARIVILDFCRDNPFAPTSTR